MSITAANVRAPLMRLCAAPVALGASAPLLLALPGIAVTLNLLLTKCN